MNLARGVMGKEIVDRDGLKSGKVDDLLLELPEGEAPIVRSIVTQNGALANRMAGWAGRLGRWFRVRVLGAEHAVEPLQIPWETVTSIDVVVHLDLDRHDAHFLDMEDAVWNRIISHLPFAGRREA